MKTKDYEPIKFEMFQGDIEKLMFNIDKALKFYEKVMADVYHTPEELDAVRSDYAQLDWIKTNLQLKIDWHKRNGEWV